MTAPAPARAAGQTEGPEGQGPCVSFDASPEQLQLFKDGYIDALIVQDPYQMGYRGVYAMDKVLKGEKVEPRVVEIPAQVVTKDNFDDPKIQELQ